MIAIGNKQGGASASFKLFYELTKEHIHFIELINIIFNCTYFFGSKVFAFYFKTRNGSAPFNMRSRIKRPVPSFSRRTIIIMYHARCADPQPVDQPFFLVALRR